jgi:hypothetical protein
MFRYKESRLFYKFENLIVCARLYLKRQIETRLVPCNADNCDLFYRVALLNKILCKLVDN